MLADSLSNMPFAHELEGTAVRIRAELLPQQRTTCMIVIHSSAKALLKPPMMSIEVSIIQRVLQLHYIDTVPQLVLCMPAVLTGTCSNTCHVCKGGRPELATLLAQSSREWAGWFERLDSPLFEQNISQVQRNAIRDFGHLYRDVGLCLAPICHSSMSAMLTRAAAEDEEAADRQPFAAVGLRHTLAWAQANHVPWVRSLPAHYRIAAPLTLFH